MSKLMGTINDVDMSKLKEIIKPALQKSASTNLYDIYFEKAESKEQISMMKFIQQYVHFKLEETRRTLREEQILPRTVFVATLDKESKTIFPEYETEYASGMDIRSYETVTLKAGETKVVGTNLAVEIPVGFELQVRSRSGLAAKNNIFVLNSPGTIDSDYRGEIKVILHNAGSEDYRVIMGDRIAQLVLCRIEHADIQEIDEVSQTERGSGGFGSTGHK